MQRGIALTLCCALLTSFALAIQTPKAPTVRIVGNAGHGEACYWVIAEDEHKRLTDVSPPAHVTNLPDKLDERNYVEITITPVDGAVRYYILKTTPLPPPARVNIQIAKRGKRTFYYWFVVCNGWRHSRIYGPYVARGCADANGNVITWTRAPNATWYHVYRTDAPIPPIGRHYYAVGLQVGIHEQIRPGMYGSRHRDLRLVDRGELGYCVVGFPETPVTEPPIGEGMFLLAVTNGAPVIDRGQELKLFVVPNVNETERTAVTVPEQNQADIRTFGMLDLKPRARLKHLARPSFISHYSALHIDNQIESGGHNEYQDTVGTPGWKSTIENISTHQTSHCASQHVMIGGYQRNYGSGDTIYLATHTTAFGCNKDNGDEGVFAIRSSMHRVLNEYTDVLVRTSPKGATKLYLKSGAFEQAGTGRLVINLSQAYREGRIVRVENVDVYGRGTRWTRDMTGRWISFDVDTVKGHRMWYQIKSVESPTHLTIIARTGWSHSCNLGWSRFIYDPEETDHPSPMFTNSHALRYLPEENRKAAREGGYMICPGTLLANPWKDGRVLNVEPLREEWHAGDEIQIAPGPQAYVYLARFMLWGDFLPQDDVGGIIINNFGSRMTNFPAIQIGTPEHEGFSEGIHITLPKCGAGDGLVISTATRWNERGLPGRSDVYRAAVVVPVNLPAMRGEYPTPYLQFQRPPDDPENPRLEVRSHRGGVIASFGERADFPRGINVHGDISIGGIIRASEHVRGKAVFSGDGKRRTFVVTFQSPFEQPPFVLISTNQFPRARIADVQRDRFTVEFEEPPKPGRNNVVIWWIALL